MFEPELLGRHDAILPVGESLERDGFALQRQQGIGRVTDLCAKAKGRSQAHHGDIFNAM
ncbi:hypothetical protein [Halomonas sp. AOP42-C2-25]|uniref:hypothetical protein n=1 Tax=Halomonas sp. AOP42-C2-25 TaxID=3457668 RepID=UPI0040340B76